MNDTKYIAWRTDFSDGRASYVAMLPGDRGVDYGYTADKDKALQLTEREARRFVSYLRKLDKGAHSQVCQVEPEPTEPQAVTYTTAEAAYDWFGTRTVAYVGTATNGKAVRKVEGPAARVEQQRDRYASGCHMAVDEDEWQRLIKFKLVETQP